MAALSSSRPNAGICTETDNANVWCDVNSITNVEKMDSDDQDDDNLSCLENELINEDNSSNFEYFWRGKE